MPRNPIPTWFFSVVVVQQEDRFLLVHERKHGQRWYLPAGRVERGETFEDAAYRETLEEAGIPVRMKGVIRVEHLPRQSGARMRVIFLAEPIDNTPLKTVADDESLGAAWVTIEELQGFSLRGDDVRQLFEYVAGGGTICPASVLQWEGTPIVVE